MGKQAFDYYYGDESNQFSFYRIPRQLITHPRFKPLSSDAKLLYGMLLDRMGLSIKNKWYDDNRRVYIYYTVEEICYDLNCGRDKAMKLLAELDDAKGVGLSASSKARASPPGYMFCVLPRRNCRPSRGTARSRLRHAQQSNLTTCRNRIFPPQQAGIFGVLTSKKSTQIIII